MNPSSNRKLVQALKGGGSVGVTVEFFADPACPWCYVGRRVLDKALAAVRKSEYEVCVCVRARGVWGGGACRWSASLACGRGPFSLSLFALSFSLSLSLSLSLSFSLSLFIHTHMHAQVEVTVEWRAWLANPTSITPPGGQVCVIHTCMCAYTHAHKHTQTHTPYGYKHTQIHTRTHKHTHTLCPCPYSVSFYLSAWSRQRP